MKALAWFSQVFCSTSMLCSTARPSGLNAQEGASSVTSDASLVANKTFDYIVVGAGTAGITVASRLSENASVTVLLIEAGGDDRKDPRIYDLFEYGQVFNTSLDWNWPTDQGRTIDG